MSALRLLLLCSQLYTTTPSASPLAQDRVQSEKQSSMMSVFIFGENLRSGARVRPQPTPTTKQTFDPDPHPGIPSLRQVQRSTEDACQLRGRGRLVRR